MVAAVATRCARVVRGAGCGVNTKGLSPSARLNLSNLMPTQEDIEGCQKTSCRKTQHLLVDIIRRLGFGDPMRRIDELEGKATPEARCPACAKEREAERERVKAVANDGKLPVEVRDAAIAWLNGGVA